MRTVRTAVNPSNDSLASRATPTHTRTHIRRKMFFLFSLSRTWHLCELEHQHLPAMLFRATAEDESTKTRRTNKRKNEREQNIVKICVEIPNRWNSVYFFLLLFLRFRRFVAVVFFLLLRSACRRIIAARNLRIHFAARFIGICVLMILEMKNKEPMANEFGASERARARRENVRQKKNKMH